MLLLSFYMVLFSACQSNTTQAVADNNMPHPVSNTTYDSFKTSVNKHKAQLAGHPSKEVSDYFYSLISNDIYSYWQGTPWDFNGTTRMPNQGSIACGYFVTTTLADVGLKINRVKLATCISGDMIKALCTNIHTYTDFKKLQAYLAQQPNRSVFIVGLDYHTGYIVKDASGSYFMHSNWIDRAGVMKEPIEASAALQNNKIFMIGSLTANKKLLDKWIAE